MKCYKTNSEIMAIDKGQEFLVKPEWLEITEEEAMLITNPPMSEEQLESERVQAIKSKAAELIGNKYPDYKQLNIIRVGGVELEAMTTYIDGIRAISNEAEKSEVKVEDIQWL